MPYSPISPRRGNGGGELGSGRGEPDVAHQRVGQAHPDAGAVDRGDRPACAGWSRKCGCRAPTILLTSVSPSDRRAEITACRPCRRRRRIPCLCRSARRPATASDRPRRCRRPRTPRRRDIGSQEFSRSGRLSVITATPAVGDLVQHSGRLSGLRTDTVGDSAGSATSVEARICIPLSVVHSASVRRGRDQRNRAALTGIQMKSLPPSTLMFAPVVARGCAWTPKRLRPDRSRSVCPASRQVRGMAEMLVDGRHQRVRVSCRPRPPIRPSRAAPRARCCPGTPRSPGSRPGANCSDRFFETTVHRRLGGGVGRQPGALPLRRVRREVHDARPLRITQQRQRGPHAAHHAHQRRRRRPPATARSVSSSKFTPPRRAHGVDERR